jgi:F0F1-type ATP synthase membrane subunit b/b'
MILSYQEYAATLEERKAKESEIHLLKESLNQEIETMKKQVTRDVKKQVSDLLTRLKPEIIREGISL